MKSIVVLVIFLLLLTEGSFAQKIKLYKIQAGENINEVIPWHELHEFEKFEKGFVYFKSGARSSAMLNYNYIHEEMVFIAAGGDTLAVVNPKEVKQIIISNDTFFFADRRFVKKDTVIGRAAIATATFFSTVSKQKIGAYGTATDVFMDYNTSFIIPNSQKIELTPQVVTTLAKQKALFIGDAYNHFQVINKETIFKLFFEKETQLKRYLENNTVNYFSRSDVIKLLSYMNTL